MKVPPIALKSYLIGIIIPICIKKNVFISSESIIHMPRYFSFLSSLFSNEIKSTNEILMKEKNLF